MNVNCVFKPEEGIKMNFEPSTLGSAGLDLVYNGKEEVIVEPFSAYTFPTGFYVEIPEGYVGYLFCRSSIGVKYLLTMPNNVGVIDSDYRGEVKCCLYNLNKEPVKIEPGQRIAQLVISPYIKAEYNLVEELNETVRGEAGIGSTGK